MCGNHLSDLNEQLSNQHDQQQIKDGGGKKYSLSKIMENNMTTR